jgi:hypothetical protein
MSRKQYKHLNACGFLLRKEWNKPTKESYWFTEDEFISMSHKKRQSILYQLKGLGLNKYAEYLKELASVLVVKNH